MDEKTLNRIKIKDLFSAIRKETNADSEIRLMILEILAEREANALERATEEDLRKVEKLYIEKTLKIKYFPSQKKKSVKIGDESKIVPIETIYGSGST